jgi:hypothetical protein
MLQGRLARALEFAPTNILKLDAIRVESRRLIKIDGNTEFLPNPPARLVRQVNTGLERSAIKRYKRQYI